MHYYLGDVYNFSAIAGEVTGELLRDIIVEVKAWRCALLNRDRIEEVRHREVFRALTTCLAKGRDSLLLGRPPLEDALWNLYQLITTRPGATDREKGEALDEVLQAANGASTAPPPADAQGQRTPAVDESASGPADVDWKAVLESVVDENALVIIKIAGDKSKTADQKMRDIYAIDNRVVGWDSPKWGKVLGVSADAIRQTDWWKKDRKRLIG
jgi:hypothetical protein